MAGAAMYNDAYPTCRTTYATLCILGVAPGNITEALGLHPTDSFVAGDVRHGAAMRHDGWFLSSKAFVDSKDVRRHLDWVVDQLEGKRDLLRDLAEGGAKMMISCYWVSAHGHGGPILSTPQLTKLAELGIELQFDVYFNRTEP